MEDEPIRFRNFYFHCEEKWEDDWSCASNDACPVCGTKDIEPYYSHDIQQTYDVWAERYRPIENNIAAPGSRSSIGSGEMYETYGPELEYVQQIANDSVGQYRIWTLVDVDDLTVIVAGFHFVNRLGYFITEVSFAIGSEEFLWDASPSELGEEDAEEGAS